MVYTSKDTNVTLIKCHVGLYIFHTQAYQGCIPIVYTKVTVRLFAVHFFTLMKQILLEISFVMCFIERGALIS